MASPSLSRQPTVISHRRQNSFMATLSCSNAAGLGSCFSIAETACLSSVRGPGISGAELNISPAVLGLLELGRIARRQAESEKHRDSEALECHFVLLRRVDSCPTSPGVRNDCLGHCLREQRPRLCVARGSPTRRRSSFRPPSTQPTQLSVCRVLRHRSRSTAPQPERARLRKNAPQRTTPDQLETSIRAWKGNRIFGHQRFARLKTVL
jgi:hypothetical protein